MRERVSCVEGVGEVAFKERVGEVGGGDETFEDETSPNEEVARFFNLEKKINDSFFTVTSFRNCVS